MTDSALPTASAPTRWPGWLAPVLLVCLGLAHLLCFTTLWDDAYVTFRLAERWVATGVCAFNPGPAQPIATSFLWLLLLAAGNALTGWSAPVWARILGAAAGLLIPLILFYGLRRLGRAGAAWPAAVFCVSAAAWAAWPLAGLETSLFTLEVTAGTLAVLLRARGGGPGWLAAAALAGALAALTRPDGLPLVIAGALALTFLNRNGWRDGLIYFGLAAVVLAAGAWAQAAVCGGVVPTAFYSKLHGWGNLRRGWEYLAGFAGAYRAGFLLPFLLPAWSRRSERGAATFPAVLIAAWLTWVAFAGGDFFPHYRFVAPVWPLVCLLLGLGLEDLGRILRAQASAWTPFLPGAGAVLITLLALQLLLPTFHGADHDRARAWSAVERDRRVLGEWLGANFTAEDGLALKPAGIIPYYSGLPALDFYGLLDVRLARGGTWTPENWIGHQCVTVAGALDARPRVVLLDEHLYAQENLPAPEAGDGAVERTWRAGARRSDYVPVRAEVEPGRWVQYFLRRP